MPATQHTTADATPVFPPGRYGRRRERRRAARWLSVVLAAAAVVAGLAVALRLYQQYGDPDYRAQVTRITERSDTGVTVELTVTVPSDRSAVCTLRARGGSGEEIGRDRVEVRAEAGRRRVTLTHRLTTTGRVRAVDITGCQSSDG